MKTLLRGIATLLTAALLCFNLFYELAPNLVVGPEKKFAFAPMGVFLPAVFRWQRSIFFFTATLTLAITAVEVAQVYTGTGSCDIDDLILNLAGALIVYIVCRVTPLWHRICSVTPRPKKE